jgi:hypothetical protein
MNIPGISSIDFSFIDWAGLKKLITKSREEIDEEARLRKLKHDLSSKRAALYRKMGKYGWSAELEKQITSLELR